MGSAVYDYFLKKIDFFFMPSLSFQYIDTSKLPTLGSEVVPENNIKFN